MIGKETCFKGVWILLAGLLVIGPVGLAAGVPVLSSADQSSSNGSRLVLWDNGPLVTAAGGGSGGADISEVQTAIGLSLYGGGCQVSVGNHMADDFDVLVPWHIDSLTFFTYQTTSGTTSSINEVRFQIWNGPPNAGGAVIWGDLTTNRLSETAWIGCYRVLDTAPTSVDRPIMYARCDVLIDLAPGTYWLDWMIGGSLTSGPWQPPVTILGQTTTGNSLQYTSSSGTWVEYVDSGTLTPQGLPFVIEGSADSVTVIDFDDLPSITAIGTHYPGVTFSPGWVTWDSTSSGFYPPHSTPNIAYTWETDNTVVWDCSMSYLSFYVNCYMEGSAMWEYSVYDSGGTYIASMSINSTVTNEFLEFNYPDMKRLEVRGTGNWAEYHTIDDIAYICEDSPTPTPTAECINNGDTNLSGDITAGDAQQAFLITLGLYAPTYLEECAADCNGNDEVTAGDAQAIFLKVLGLGICVDPL